MVEMKEPAEAMDTPKTNPSAPAEDASGDDSAALQVHGGAEWPFRSERTPAGGDLTVRGSSG